MITSAWIPVLCYSLFVTIVHCQTAFDKEILHLQTDLSIVDLGTLFMEDDIDFANPVDYELDGLSQEVSFLPGIRLNTSKVDFPVGFGLSACKQWAPVFYPNQQDYVWLSICNKTEMTVFFEG